MSYKTWVFEHIFTSRWNPAKEAIENAIVSLQDVSDAIAEYNRLHGSNYSTRNPANFFKDFVRKTSTANANWPQSVFERGYTARQVTGRGQCFEYVRLKENQTQPFTSVPPPPLDRIHYIETAACP